MARLPKGVAPVPHKIRQRGYRQDLKARGGRRLNAELEAEATSALAAIEATGKKAKEAVSDALIAYAAALPGKPPAS